MESQRWLETSPRRMLNGLYPPWMGLGAHGSQNHRITGWKRPLRSSSPTVSPTPPCLLNHVPKDGSWHPCPGDQPFSSLRQTAFPDHHSARSMTAPTGGCADASIPFASPTSPVSPTASAEPGLQGQGAGSSFNDCPRRCPKAEAAVRASIPADQYVLTLGAPMLPSLPLLRMPQPYRHPGGDGG